MKRIFVQEFEKRWAKTQDDADKFMKQAQSEADKLVKQAQNETDKIVRQAQKETDKTFGRFCAFELRNLERLHNFLYSPIMDKFMVTVTSTGNLGIIWIFTAFILLFAGDRPRIGYALLIALLLGILIGNLIIKNIVKRNRPFFHKNYKLLIKQPWDYSFPSGHTLASFASITVLFYMNQAVGIIALIWGSLIALSRLYLRVHFFTDVFFSMVLGVILGILGMKIYETHLFGLWEYWSVWVSSWNL